MHLYVVNSGESKGNMKGNRTENPALSDMYKEYSGPPSLAIRQVTGGLMRGCIEYISGVARFRQDITAIPLKTTVTWGPIT